MGDATEETFEMNEDGPVDSQEPLTAGYAKEKDGEVYVVGEKDRKKVYILDIMITPILWDSMSSQSEHADIFGLRIHNLR